MANDDLWEAVDEFQDRWERTINAMTKDVEEISGRLSKVASNYIDYNTAAEQKLAPVKSAAEALPTDSLMGGS